MYKKRYSIFFFSFRFYRFTEISFRFVSVSQVFVTLSVSFPFRFRNVSVFSVSFLVWKLIIDELELSEISTTAVLKLASLSGRFGSVF
jgi:hypothetical protein